MVWDVDARADHPRNIPRTSPAFCEALVRTSARVSPPCPLLLVVRLPSERAGAITRDLARCHLLLRGPPPQNGGLIWFAAPQTGRRVACRAAVGGHACGCEPAAVPTRDRAMPLRVPAAGGCRTLLWAVAQGPKPRPLRRSWAMRENGPGAGPAAPCTGARVPAHGAARCVWPAMTPRGPLCLRGLCGVISSCLCADPPPPPAAPQKVTCTRKHQPHIPSAYDNPLPPPPPATTPSPPRSLLQPASGGLLFSAIPVMHGVFIRH